MLRPAPALKTVIFKRILNKKRYFFNPGRSGPLAPTGPGAQNRYFSKGFSIKNDTFSVPAHWRISAPLPAPFRHPLLWRASAAPAGDSAWVCVPSATGRVPTRNRQGRFTRGSEGHWKAIGGASEGHRKPIGSPSEAHRMAIGRLSDGRKRGLAIPRGYASRDQRDACPRRINRP